MPGKWVVVRYFAVARDRAGLSEERVELPLEAVAGDVLEAVLARHPTLEPLRGRIRVAVNEELVSEGAPVNEGDELALLPPVAGGSSLVRMTEEPLSVDQAIAAVSHPGAGGICVFLGVVRDESGGLPVTSLEYEAYGSMALREMAKIIDELQTELPGVRLAVVHRVGSLGIGEPAVVIAASAPHRADAFAACRQMIDRLKERVPIWKREHGPEGAHWVGVTRDA